MKLCLPSNNPRPSATEFSQKINLLLVGFLLLLSGLATAQTKYYVDADNVNSGNGLSWENAFDSLQAALDVVIEADTIWIAEGTYKPSLEHGGVTTRHQTFYLDIDLAIYGGFDGTEMTLR